MSEWIRNDRWAIKAWVRSTCPKSHPYHLFMGRSYSLFTRGHAYHATFAWLLALPASLSQKKNNRRLLFHCHLQVQMWITCMCNWLSSDPQNTSLWINFNGPLRYFVYFMKQILFSSCFFSFSKATPKTKILLAPWMICKSWYHHSPTAYFWSREATWVGWFWHKNVH